MKILVISDTHRNFGALKNAIDSVPDADMLIHLGDGEYEFEDVRNLYPLMPMIYVGGNCDYGEHEQTHIVTACGRKIFCTHGHLFRVRENRDLLAAAAVQNGCEVALYGHTHVKRIETQNGVLILNPGSVDCPRGGNKPSFAVLTISSAGEIFPEIIDVEN